MVEPKILTLGITGGIGSGKSYVASLLSERGIPVYDTDSRAKALYDEDSTLRQELIQLFGSQLYRTADGRLDRQALAKIIFGDREALAKVNALVHPAVRRDFLHWREGLLTEDMRLCALESALLLDAGLEYRRGSLRRASTRASDAARWCPPGGHTLTDGSSATPAGDDTTLRLYDLQ